LAAVSSPEPSARLSLALRPNASEAGTVTLDVFADALSGVRCFQLGMVASGGTQGNLILDGMTFQPPPGHVALFAELEHFSAIDTERGRLVSCLVRGSVSTTARRHLAGFRLRFAADALGLFTLNLTPSNTVLLDSLGRRFNLHELSWEPLLVSVP
jgi:hypothetical protein